MDLESWYILVGVFRRSFWKSIHLRRNNKIILTQSPNCMCPEREGAFSPRDFEIWVVIFTVCDICDFRKESASLFEVFEGECAGDQ